MVEVSLPPGVCMALPASSWVCVPHVCADVVPPRGGSRSRTQTGLRFESSEGFPESVGLQLALGQLCRCCEQDHKVPSPPQLAWFPTADVSPGHLRALRPDGDDTREAGKFQMLPQFPHLAQTFLELLFILDTLLGKEQRGW